MEKYEIIRDTLKRHPEIMSSRQSLKSVLCDILPTDKLIVNMFLMAYDEGIFTKIKQARTTTIDRIAFEKYTNELSTSYGVTPQIAHDTILLVAGVLNKTVITPAPTLDNSSEPAQSPTQVMNNRMPVPPKPRQAAFSSVKDFLYASNGSEVRINKYVGKGGNVVIPDYIDGLPVTRIAEDSFDYQKYSRKITALQLPAYLQYIGDSAFQNLESLSGVLVLPSTVKEVGYHAFQSTGLKGLVIQSSCQLRMNSFANIYGMEFIYVAKGCAPEVGHSVFSYAEALKDLVLPREISEIAEETFAACNEAILYAPAGSYAANYGRKSFMRVDSTRYEQMNKYYQSIYGK